MSEIKLTQSDIGKRFRLRNGEVVKIVDIDKYRRNYFKFKGCDKSYRTEQGVCECHAHHLDIIERLPEEGVEIHPHGEPEKLKASRGSTFPFNGDPNKIQEIPLPSTKSIMTFPASDGKEYPAAWFAQQQSFEEHLPPEGVEIICDGKLYALRGDRICQIDGPVIWPIGKARNAFWTLTPAAPKPKQEPNVWDEYMSHPRCFKFKTNQGSVALVLDEDLSAMSDQIDALYAWKNYTLSEKE